VQPARRSERADRATAGAYTVAWDGIGTSTTCANPHDRSIGRDDGDVHAEHLQAVRHGATLVANTDAVEP